MKRLITLSAVLAFQLLAAGRLHAVWQFSNSGTANSLNGVFFVDSSTGWAVGASGTIIKTADAGSTWSAQTSGAVSTLHDAQFSGTSTGIAVGAGGLILRTTDAVTWQTMTNNVSASDLLAASWSVSTGTVWAVGESGTILVSTNSGNKWDDGDPGNGAPSLRLRAVYFVNASTGWIVGDSGTYLRTGNGGNTWAAISAGGTSQDLKDVFFVDSSTGFIAGDNGIILKSTDCGSTWGSRISTATDFNAVHFVTNSLGWAVGEAGIVVASTDSGNSFYSETSSAAAALNDVFFVTSTLGFAVGDSGLVIKSVPASSLVPVTSSTGAVEQQGDLTPLNNLIDPSIGQFTTLQYLFKKAGRVTIKIYTMQGRLVKTLLDEYKTDGVYQDVIWGGRNENGETVASGIYLAHIEAPNFSSSKKIAVIR